MMLPGGKLKLIDRKKDVFKLSQGEFVSPVHLEGLYKKCSFVEQIWITGSSEKPFLVAVCVPNVPTLIRWAKEKAIPVRSHCSRR
jgi:long-chain acyl-CoA synthetase